MKTFDGWTVEKPWGETEFEKAVALRVVNLVNTLMTKHHDYGPKNIADSPGGPLNGLRVRMYDKLARINHLVETGADPKNESLQDSFKDLAGYGLIGMLVLNGEWPGTEAGT